MSSGYEFMMANPNRGVRLTIHDGDKQKFRKGSDYRKGGNGFGMSESDVPYTITVRDRHMVSIFR